MKRKRTTCENCLGDFNFASDDIYGAVSDGEFEIHLDCPYCGHENDIYYLEEYGITMEELLENGQLESRNEDQSEDW